MPPAAPDHGATSLSSTRGAGTSTAASGTTPAAPIVLIGALHVDELLWPLGALVPRASNPVRHERRVGGVAANVARAAVRTVTRSGYPPVTLVAALGEDTDGHWLRTSLAASGIECRVQVVAGRASGRYTVVHDAGGELFVGLADTGIAETLDADTVLARLAGVRPAALVLDANLDAACIATLVGPATASVTTAEGSAPVPDSVPRIALTVSPAKASRFAPHLPALELLFCNRREAAALGGLDASASISVLADALAERGCTRFVLSDGTEPVLVQTSAGRALVPVPPFAVVGSVNGAGDALAGATLARWLAGDALVDAVRDAGLPAAREIVRAGTGMRTDALP